MLDFDGLALAYGWAGIAGWALLYVSDYALTLVGAGLYEGGAKKHVATTAGYELNPLFREDIARRRRVSPRFVRQHVLATLLLVAAWLLDRYHFARLPGDRVRVFPLMLGLFLLSQVAVHLRHLQALVLLRHLSRSEGVQGQVVYAMWLPVRLVAAEFAGFAALYALAFLACGQSLFLGGALSCGALAVRYAALSRRERRANPRPESVPEGGTQSALPAGDSGDTTCGPHGQQGYPQQEPRSRLTKP